MPWLSGRMMATEYRVVQWLNPERISRWPKRNLAHAEKAVKDLIRDHKRAPYMEGAVVWIETREVGEWSRDEGLF